MNIQSWVPLGLTGLISLLSKGLSRVLSSTTVWKYQLFSVRCVCTQSCLTLCDPMDCNLPGCSVHGTFQARILERIAILLVLSLLYGPNRTSIYDYWKTVALTIWTFVGKVISLLFNTLSRFVIAFLPRSKCLLIPWLQSSSIVVLEPRKTKSVTIPTFSPSVFQMPWSLLSECWV